MRVIGGDARGRRLDAGQSATLRPTSDRVREAMFDVLMHLDAIEDAQVLDLYCGTGALGIEALSRGAAHVTFVDSDRGALALVEKNLAATGLGAPGTTRIEGREALAYLRSTTQRFDLAFCDPPYAFDAWGELLGHLPAALAVLESRRPVETTAPFILHRSYRYGTTLVAVVTRHFDGPDGAAR